MKLQIFALLDIKTGAYGTPWFMRHGAEAMRAVGDLAQDRNTTVGRHPADYQLVCLGYWDDQSGAFEGLAAPIVLGTAVSMIPEPAGAAPLLDFGAIKRNGRADGFVEEGSADA